ncbi:type VI secretion system protein TssL, long form [Burkholderia metallica]|uniref:type VI secretion system protein TssL, long form n=1 Tax=Burkholderia metallica TaxID=488729 RepID=UPI003F50DE8E
MTNETDGLENPDTLDGSIPSGEMPEDRLRRILAATNPLLEASRVLLRALADMPYSLSSSAVEQLRELLGQEVDEFKKLCTQANIRRDHMVGASYCLCTALDEVAMRTACAHDRALAAAWVHTSLAATFHRDVDGGEKIYMLIGRLVSEPREHRDLLEVIYRVLSLGFEGRYRFEAGGARRHGEIRRHIYTEIMSRREPVPQALSPHWKSDARKPHMSFWEFPVWITATVLSVALLGLFGYFKYELATHSVGIQKQIADIGRMTPPPVPQQLHLKQLLKDEIAAGTVSVDEDARHSAVTFRGDAMFQPGGVAVKPAMAPLVAKIAGEIVKVPGKVTVLGYTDNLPIRSRQFPSNGALSEERATQVMQMLQAAGVPANRLEAVGKGDAEPIGDNRTSQGRALNRRVEIVVAH